MNQGLKYGLYAAAFLAALGLSAYLTTVVLVKAQPEVKTPDLIGEDAIIALKTVSDLGLNLKVRAFDHSDQIPKNHIISQDPEADVHIKKDREVWVVLSKGGASSPAPDLRGLGLDQAVSLLRQSGLSKGRISYTHGAGPQQGRDRILAQTPEPLTRVKTGAAVDLLVSLGPRPQRQIMPDLTGRPYSLVLITLEQHDLAVGRIETQHRRNWPMETVLLQDPAPGAPVRKGGLVRLTVNQDEDAELAGYRFHVFTHRMPYGLFHREVKLRVSMGAYLVNLFEQWRPPGDVVRVAALIQGPPRAQVFEDGREMPLPNPEFPYQGVLDDQDSALHPFGRLFPPGR